MHTTLNINETVVDMKASAYIDPNKAHVLNYFGPARRKQNRDLISALLDINGINGDPDNEKLVDLVFRSADCDNMREQYFKIIVNNKSYDCAIPIRYLPLSLIEGRKEGEHISLKYPVEAHLPDWRETIKVILNIDLELRQLNCIFRRFGAFEQCLAYVSLVT